MIEQMQSAEIGELAKALAAVQGELTPAPKNAKNPGLGNKYADLQSCISTLQAVLPKNGLAFTQTILPAEENTVSVATMLMHQSGQWVRGICTLPTVGNRGVNAAQAAGSAITYARRYGLSAIVGLVADDDDDGNAAAPSRKQEQAVQRAVREEARSSNPEHPDKKQLAAMFAALRSIGVTEKEACMTEVQAIIGRSIQSSLELTRDEYQKVMRELENAKMGAAEPF